MVALKAGEVVDRLRKPLDAKILVYLFYGPDAGLVHERCTSLLQKAKAQQGTVECVSLEGDSIAADPMVLLDEANSISMFGDRRVLWLKASGKNIAPAVEKLLNNPPQETLIMIDSGDLGKTAPLRSVCEKSPHAYACPCYSDGARELSTLMDEIFQVHHLRISSALKAHLQDFLGGDRLASRAELEKLALYAQKDGEITLEHIEAIMGDVSALALDQIIDAAFCLDKGGLDQAFNRAIAENLDASVILVMCQKHAFQLLTLCKDIESELPIAQVLDKNKSLHFKRKPFLEKQLRIWNTVSLMDVAPMLSEAVVVCRRNTNLSAALAHRALLNMGSSTRR
jgi:DNA polymerase III subunit delta